MRRGIILCLPSPNGIDSLILVLFFVPHCTSKGKFGVFSLSLQHDSIKFLTVNDLAKSESQEFCLQIEGDRRFHFQ
jgi:hypothetical protein